jgi:hypothetical protein
MDSQKNVERDLLTDGYLTQMFGPQVAEEYHTFMLRGEPGQIGQIQRQTDVTGAGAFFAPPPPGSQVMASGQHGLVIDLAIKPTGLVIRQKLWAPKNPSDKKRWVDHASEELHPPIFFVHKNGQDLGLPLIEAAAGDCMRLRDADKSAPVGSSVHARIRINVSSIFNIHSAELMVKVSYPSQWCGYAYLNWSKQISIQRQMQAQTQPNETIKLETFAKHVAKTTKDFMEVILIPLSKRSPGI